MQIDEAVKKSVRQYINIQTYFTEMIMQKSALLTLVNDDGDRYFIFLVESGESGDKESGKVSSR